MPKLKYVEDMIQKIEGFDVAFTRGETDVRGDKGNIPRYPYVYAASYHWTVAEWIANRFNQCYLGYGVRVFPKEGNAAVGHMKLAAIREQK